MRRDKYEETVGKIYMRELYKKVGFLAELPFAKCLQKHELILLAANTERVKVPSNTILINQAELCSSVFFIKSGLVKIVRKVAFLPKMKYYKLESEYG